MATRHSKENDFLEQTIVESWNRNAHAWIQAVRNDEIETRSAATNKAIVDAVLDSRPRSVADFGCGEGWLVRELVARGIDCLGIDAIPELIESAKATGIGRFHILEYREVPVAIGERFDTVVCNFSLFGNSSVAALLPVIPTLLNRPGALLIQTLHPHAAGKGDSSGDGWRESLWDGFNREFRGVLPWFYRTPDSWISSLLGAGFDSVDVREILDPRTALPVSTIFVGKVFAESL